MASSLRLLICGLTSIALIFQIIPVISIPVVHSIYLSHYNGRAFGVFGWCSTSTNVCAARRIGYVTSCENGSDTVDLNDFECAELESPGEFLPSRAKRDISKLLIVHPISLFFTFLLWLLMVAINSRRLGQSRKILTCTVLWSLPAVFLSLLSFLVDILLFVPFLAWPGWLLLVSTVLMGVASFMMCGVRRSVSLQKYEKLRNGEHIDLFPLQFEKARSEDLQGSRRRSEESSTPVQTLLERPELVHRSV
ncbi:LANO_0E13190g1_1 [Lachancea nothofagi CBS 11611]|uniref:LANO_0E13190g1_1 n=1 Tax=Lachancea nothofagi CBS 11611 TaxID=1266666 RepID=A0A1G4JYQ2_9SACH|nr:LANO_0E13190g1_1 [Lachancea nothofagi CBS 11611]